MSYNKIMKIVDTYYKLKTFNPEEIKNENLREELLNTPVFTFYDGFVDHTDVIQNVLEDPQNYKLNTLEDTLSQICMYKHFDEISTNKKTTEIKGFKKEDNKDIKIIGVNDETDNKE